MIWREYFADKLPEYFKIFVALLLGTLFLNAYTGAARFRSIWFVLLLLMVAIVMGKLNELLPLTKNRWKVKLFTTVTYAVVIASLWRISSQFQLNWVGTITVQIGTVAGTVFITLVTSMFVFDEHCRVHEIKKAPY